MANYSLGVRRAFTTAVNQYHVAQQQQGFHPCVQVHVAPTLAELPKVFGAPPTAAAPAVLIRAAQEAPAWKIAAGLDLLNEFGAAEARLGYPRTVPGHAVNSVGAARQYALRGHAQCGTPAFLRTFDYQPSPFVAFARSTLFAHDYFVDRSSPTSFVGTVLKVHECFDQRPGRFGIVGVGTETIPSWMIHPSIAVMQSAQLAAGTIISGVVWHDIVPPKISVVTLSLLALAEGDDVMYRELPNASDFRDWVFVNGDCTSINASPPDRVTLEDGATFCERTDMGYEDNGILLYFGARSGCRGELRDAATETYWGRGKPLLIV